MENKKVYNVVFTENVDCGFNMDVATFVNKEDAEKALLEKYNLLVEDLMSNDEESGEELFDVNEYNDERLTFNIIVSDWDYICEGRVLETEVQ